MGRRRSCLVLCFNRCRTQPWANICRRHALGLHRIIRRDSGWFVVLVNTARADWGAWVCIGGVKCDCQSFISSLARRAAESAMSFPEYQFPDVPPLASGVGDCLCHCFQSPAGPSLRPPFRQKVRRDDPLCLDSAPRAGFWPSRRPLRTAVSCSSLLLAQPGQFSVPLLTRAPTAGRRAGRDRRRASRQPEGR
jgi:hypothetical protein